MIRIQLANGILDTYQDETVELSWTSLRFSKGLRDPYTNDFKIPKTRNNLNILGATGLIDSDTQVFGTAFAPATFTTDDGLPRAVKIQVAAVTDKDIKICLYETVIDPDTMGKNIRELITDKQSSILRWDSKSMTNYPDWFKKYDAGSIYNTNAYQLHPSKKLKEIVNLINAQYGYNIPLNDNVILPDERLIATRKVVCPQNVKQTVMGFYEPSDEDTTQEMRNTLKLLGSQHVTNDMSGAAKSTTHTEITYNRYVHAFMNLHISWEMPTSYGTYRLQVIKNNTDVIQTIYITVPTDKTNGVISTTLDYVANNGDTITFRLVSPHYFSHLAILADYTNNFYQVTEDDYSTPLVYEANPPYLMLYQYYNTSGIHEVKCYADGRTYTVSDNNNGTSHMSYSLPSLSMSYFGYWCNLPDLTIKDLLFGLCWLRGRKLVVESDTLHYEWAIERTTINGTIKELRPTSSYLGQSSTIKWNNDPNPLTYHFDNTWLEKEHNIYTSVFEYVGLKKISDNPNASPIGVINQYTWEYNNEGDIETEFNEISNPVIMNTVAWSGQSYLTRPSSINNMGFVDIKKVLEADIECPNQIIKETDFVILNGHRYMAISGTISVNKKSTKLKALLMD